MEQLLPTGSAPHQVIADCGELLYERNVIAVILPYSELYY
jgi:hypothetical protein